MKATDLRLGNLVATVHRPDEPDFVLMLEPCLVQLLGDTLFQEEHDIIGVPIDASRLHRWGIPHREWFPMGLSKVYVSVLYPRSSVQVHVGRYLHKVTCLHELQNLLFDLTGEHLITHPHIHRPFEAPQNEGHARAC